MRDVARFGLLFTPRYVVAVFTSYFKDDYSEARLEPRVFQVVDGIFGQGNRPE